MLMTIKQLLHLSIAEYVGMYLYSSDLEKKPLLILFDWVWIIPSAWEKRGDRDISSEFDGLSVRSAELNGKSTIHTAAYSSVFSL